MTKKQRIEHKIGNQVRKLRIQQLSRHLQDGHYWARTIGCIQNGRYTNLPALVGLRRSFHAARPQES